jgi:hypothetical protein
MLITDSSLLTLRFSSYLLLCPSLVPPSWPATAFSLHTSLDLHYISPLFMRSILMLLEPDLFPRASCFPCPASLLIHGRWWWTMTMTALLHLFSRKWFSGRSYFNTSFAQPLRFSLSPLNRPSFRTHVFHPRCFWIKFILTARVFPGFGLVHFQLFIHFPTFSFVFLNRSLVFGHYVPGLDWMTTAPFFMRNGNE